MPQTLTPRAARTYVLATMVIVMALLIGCVAAAEDASEVEGASQEQLASCIVKRGVGVLEQAACYEAALVFDPTNVTLYASLSLCYLKGDCIHAAHEAMNTTVRLWLSQEGKKVVKAEEVMGDNALDAVDMLRRVHDLYKGKEDERGRRRSIEVGMVMAKKFELDHNPTDAHRIYHNFLGQLGLGQDAMVDFHRRTGNVIALTHIANTNVSLGFSIVEAINAIVDGVIPHLMSVGEISQSRPLLRMCGTNFKHGSNDEITSRSIIAKVMDCVEEWGNYTQILEKENPRDKVARQYSALKYTPLHRMAFLNAEYLLKKTLEHLGDKKRIPTDRFGRGLLHYAAGGAAPETVKLLLEPGSNHDTADGNKILPANLGCTVPKFKANYEAAAAAGGGGGDTPLANGGDGTCEGFTRHPYTDLDIDITDETGSDAGWNPKKLKNPPARCDFDVRDMSKWYQHDINLQHILPNYPVVLRNAFFEEDDGPRREWGKKAFKKSFGQVLVRHETTPGGERFGIGRANVTTIGQYLETLEDEDGTIASVLVDNAAHRLDKIANWLPPSLVRKKTGLTEVTYFDLETTSPTLIINKKGSASHHQVKAYMHYHTVFYGWQEFTLLPPHLARTVRGQLITEGQKEHALRCHLHTGDVLVLPEMWSSSWTSHANGLSVERSFYRAGGQD